jgi:beta-phosphoglucomutase-like phosphatase (HAD superfamily)
MVLSGWVPTAVVFDCDGLLMDTEPCWTIAETEVFARRGLGFGPDQKAMVIGQSLQAAGDLMAEAFGEPGRGAAIGQELLGLVEQVVKDCDQAKTGAHDLVELVAARVPVAVASNSPRGLLDVALRRGGFEDVFSVSIAADEVQRAKPAPDMYEQACQALGRTPGQCLAFEDSMTGVCSAMGAGLRTVAVPTLNRGDFPADWVVADLAEPDLVSWVRTW